MNRERTGQALFAGAVALAAALYALTAPEGLPWNESTRLAADYLGGRGSPSLPHAVWGFYVVVFGGTVALSASLAALASGLLASVVNRYFGWRFAAASALVWTFLPWVWNCAITGERSVCLTAAFIGAAWALNAVALWVTRRARANKPDSAQSVAKRLGRVNRIAGWATLGLAGVFSVVSASFHDYRLGEAASVYARGVVEEAGENNRMFERGGRIIVMNGVCDEQILRELEKVKGRGQEKKVKVRGEGEQWRVSNSTVQPSASNLQPATPIPLALQAISLRDDEACRRRLADWARNDFPADTNLWVSARVGVAAFLEIALRKYPDRFYRMDGMSSTIDGWERRWQDFRPWAASSDPFATAGRRLFGYEGNCIANAICDGKVKVKGEGEQWRVSNSTVQPSAFNLQPAAAKLAWQLYKRIYEEIDPGNFSALVNMSEMMRRGHAVGAQERKAVQSGLDAFYRDVRKSRHAREIVRISGPVRADPEMIAQLAAEAKKRIAERIAAGEKIEVSTEVMTFVEWNNEMVRAAEGGDLEQAARLARKILSNPQWRQAVSANALLGTALAKEGDYAASVAFFQAAAGTTNAVPAVVLNDYADTLMRLGDMAEAERVARRAVAASDERYWLARLTLAQVLEKRVEKLVLTEVVEEGVAVERYVKIDGAKEIEDEIRALLMSVVKNGPANVRDVVRTEHRRFMR